MASLSPSAKQSFLTNAGLPAAGYSLYTYATGTTTPLATYTDKAGSVANANPIALDARGEAIIYLLPQQYRYVLQDTLGSTIWTRDNVSPSADTADLAASGSNQGASLIGYLAGTVKSFLDSLAAAADTTGAYLIAFIQKGTSAVARTLQDKARERVSVFDFMTVAQIVDSRLASPTLDVTTAFQAAAAACTQTGVDSHLHIPRGTYNISSSINISFSGVVSGSGTQDTIINCASATAGAFNTVGSFGRIVFRDFAIKAGVTQTAGAGILLNTPNPTDSPQSSARIENITMTGMYEGFKALNAGYWSVSGCTFYNSVLNAIYSDCTQNFDAGDNTICGGTLISGGAGGTGIRILNNCKISATKVLGHSVGILIQPSTVAGTRVDTQIGTNVSVENQTTIGIQVISNGATATVANFSIIGAQIGLFASGARAISMNGSVGGFAINGNTIVLSGTGQIGIIGIGNTDGAPGNGIIANNIITGGDATATGIYTSGPGILVSDNQILSLGTQLNVAAAGTTVRGHTCTFANLPANAANGSIIYCSDGTAANPVAAGGTGCFAKRLNGVWVGN